MTDKAELSILLDYYGAFLTERQYELSCMSADEDMSLSEIAEQVGISRQAVRDSLSKASAQLHEFEDRLHYAEHDRLLRGIAELLRKSLELDENGLRNAAAEALEKINEVIK